MTRTEALAALEITGDASPTEIKRQYRQLSLRHHPDRVHGAAEKKKAHGAFLLIRDAYEFLKNNPSFNTEGGKDRRAATSTERAAQEAELREWIRQFHEEESRPKPWGSIGMPSARKRKWLGILALFVLGQFVVMWGVGIDPSESWRAISILDSFLLFVLYVRLRRAG